ncbi:MAG TPA: ClpXP protease specificity-enhancing factor [Gammaproteobacteria bacterium]|nr:ClpXP protease specificity-enhancing factor [Gammaproteobacteria bacterium]
MTTSKPYLVRAIHQWIVDNELTPYLLVHVDHPGVEVPMEFVEDDKIILNVAPKATRNLDIDNHWCCFSARFSDSFKVVRLPMVAIQAVYCKENSQGMFFDEDEADDTLHGLDLSYSGSDSEEDDEPPPSGGGSSSKSHLTVVK